MRYSTEYLCQAADAGNREAVEELVLTDDWRDWDSGPAFRFKEWLEIPAEQGDAESMYLLAKCYYQGSHAPKDYYTSEKWALKAKKEGEVRANLVLRDLYSTRNEYMGSIANAVLEEMKEAEAGGRIAMCDVGDRFRNGEGVKVDPENAAKWYLRSRTVSARVALAEMYESGEWSPEIKPNPRKKVNRGHPSRISR
mgnify:CR=1 FL=1